MGDTRIMMVDRCALFPRRHDDCPTFNSFACASVAHLVPGLEETFVFMEDDFFLVSPMQPSMFFSREGSPLIDFHLDEHSFQKVYERTRQGPDVPPEHVPRRLSESWPYVLHACHSPMPMLVSFSMAMEEEFSDWFSFLRSHKHRFQCCDASK